MKWEELLESAIAQEVSDILLSPGSPPVIRHKSQWLPQPGLALTGEVVLKVIERVVPAGGLDAFRESKDFDFATDLNGRRFRGNAYFRNGEPGLALRLLPAKIPLPDELGLPKVLSELVLRPTGLILFTGAAGQGKSTSQAALIHHLNQHQARHVVTIEDPIEYVHHPERCVIDQREVGRDTLTFAAGLRHVLRQAPDVILIGEMRDLETMQSALSIAETGHLVLSTVHTNDAVQALVRVIDAFPEAARMTVRTQLSLIISAIVNQRLVKGIDGELCLACEVLVNTPAVSAQIRDGHFEQIYSTMEIDRKSGMQTINHSLEDLVTRGKVDPQLAERYMIVRESHRGRSSVVPPAPR